MARIVLADDGIEFDGATPHNRPLGGAESSVVFLVQELAKRGHDVHVRNKCAAAVRHEGVDWAPIQTADRNLGLMPTSTSPTAGTSFSPSCRRRGGPPFGYTIRPATC